MCKNTSNASSHSLSSSKNPFCRSRSSSRSLSSSRGLSSTKRLSSSKSHSCLPDHFNITNIQEERLEELRQYLREMFDNLVLPECTKDLISDSGSVIDIPEEVLNEIIDTLIEVGEQEICGVNGGILVVKFGTNEHELTRRFVINSSFMSIYEIHLSLNPSNNIVHKMSNLIRRFKAKPPVAVIDPEFTVITKQLYEFRD